MLYNNYTQQQYKSHHIIIPANQTTGALILGDLNAATDQQITNSYNIKTIITAACGLQHLKIPSTLTHVVFPLMDTKQENIETYFQLSFKTIEQNLKKGAVLVHCGAGISRSATLVIAYYMKKYNSPFKQAIGYVKKIKPNVCPNLGFQLQLKNYQNQLDIVQNTPSKTSKSSHNSANRVSNLANNKKTSQNRNQPISSSYLFQIPLQTQQAFGIKNKSKTLNRNFNKTHGPRNHHKKEDTNSNLFITGKNVQKGSQVQQKEFDFYQPNKYSRKYVTKQKYIKYSDKKQSINGAFKF